MPEVQRYHVHAAIMATLESTDPAYDPVAQTTAIIGQISAQSGIRVKIVGDVTAARFFKAGDSLQWQRTLPDGTIHEEFGRVLEQNGHYILEFADGSSLPLPVRLAPIPEIDE